MIPKVSIIVTVKNEENKIEETLKALKEIDYPNYEIIIVDGGSNDNTLNIVKKFNVKLIVLPNSTPGEARNIGIKNATGQIIAITDGDCIPEKKWLKNAINLIITQTNIAGVGGPILAYENSSKLSKQIFYVVSTPFGNAGSTNFARFKNLKNVNNIPSCNAIYRKDILEEVGFFSNELRYCEDVELNYRIKQKGYRILYSPEVCVKHNWKVNSLLDLFKFFYHYGVGRAVAIRKNKKLISIPHILPSFGLFLILQSIIFSFFIKFFTYLSTILLFSYIAAAIIFGITYALKFKNFRIFILALPVYIITHLSYALGFYFGLIRNENAYIKEKNACGS